MLWSKTAATIVLSEELGNGRLNPLSHLDCHPHCILCWLAPLLVLLWRKRMRCHERRAEGFVQGGSSEGQALGSMFLGSQHGNSLRLKIFNNSTLLMLTRQY